MGQKKRKMSFYFCFIALLITMPLSITSVQAKDSMQENNPKIIVIYSSVNEEIDEHQRMLDMLLGHFSTNITFKPASQVKEMDFSQADYVFYYGQQREILPESFIKMISSYKGTFVSIGYNAYQFGERFDNIEWISNTAEIERITQMNNPTKEQPFDPTSILYINITEDEQTEILLTGHMKKKEYPLFLRKQNTYYLAATTIQHPLSIFVANALYEVFGEPPAMNVDTHPGYIRLEDVHPMVNPNHLMGIAKILAEKNIPYMIAVIPVYTNPITKEQHHFSDSPELIKTLKFMQKNGGSIVLHGYTHQFRLSETGEGFEFWDTENNMPIYHNQDEEVIIKTEDDFNTVSDYEQYLHEQKTHEKSYIEERLTKGIEELANYGLYPLAFEAPHYTMSQQGYQITSKYFSTYVGQLQLSDQDWKVMAAAPYITTPSFLHGMQLLPETIGYVDPEDPLALDKMIQNAKEHQIVRNGMVAGFFHPYLGVEVFQEFIEEMEKLPNINWIDLKEMNHNVQTEHVDIQAKEGNITVNMKRMGLFMSSWDYLSYHLKAILLKMLWGFAVIGGLAVLAFVYLTLINRKRYVKRGD
ncbi:polysaccharide deacetylase family protein [Virgibacillus halodenitrificans]|uniref:DUF2334 domain-containing protein n=1 Tax=Virgibacillus TaxID=84406 RepID=UPI0004D0BB2C|nr:MULTISPECIES: polysaccharide deacetylase family protein [Virgibacillus]AIF45541.1 hypothetical protein X953_16155 [Virgibacillus sp. SK37]MCG1027092.1 polysaccharide deacetylase family protein [Virgibacillus halodenitrificans]MEC2159701.1 DUF2334 domain-containing protein [Virgibacillus halodenitrificans]